MSLFSWLKANDNLYDESPAVVDVNSHLPHLHIVVRIAATGIAGVVGNGYITDHFHGPYYVHINEVGDLGVWEVGADLDPVAYYPAGNFHSVTTYTEDEWADMHPDEEYELDTTKLGVDPLGPRPNGRYNAAYLLEEDVNND